jgi:hypothetical protein
MSTYRPHGAPTADQFVSNDRFESDVDAFTGDVPALAATACSAWHRHRAGLMRRAERLARQGQHEDALRAYLAARTPLVLVSGGVDTYLGIGRTAATAAVNRLIDDGTLTPESALDRLDPLASALTNHYGFEVAR